MAATKINPFQWKSGTLSDNIKITLLDTTSLLELAYADGTSGLVIEDNTVPNATLNSKDLTASVGVSNNSVKFRSGNALTAEFISGTLRFYDDDASNYVAVQAPGTIGTNYTLTLPTAVGGAGQYLKTDATGILSWDTPAGGGSSSGVAGSVQYSDGSGGFLAEESNFFYDATNNKLTLSNSTSTHYNLEVFSDNGGLLISPVTTGLTGAFNAINATGSTTGSMNINLTNSNTGSTANSRILVSTASAGGDPYIGVSTGDATFIMGVDNSEDKFKIGLGSNPSTMTNNSIVIVANKLGVSGQTSPTAALHLPAGTAAAESAPLKFTTGTALTTPEDGSLEYHGSHLYFTIGSTRYQLDQQGGSVADGDYGDISVSTGGTVWTIDNLAVTNAKINDVSVAKLTSGTLVNALTLTVGATNSFNFNYSASNAVTIDDNANSVQIFSKDSTNSILVDNSGIQFSDGTASMIYTAGELRIYDSDSTQYVGIKTPLTGNLTTSYTLTLPNDDGSANQALTTNGSGVLSWSTVATGDVTGPAGSTADNIVTFNGATGKIIKDSGKAAPSGVIVGTTDTQTLSNKRIDPRVTSVATEATTTPDVSTTDIHIITAQNGNIDMRDPIGTPVQGTRLLIRIKDNGNARTITWTSSTKYRAMGVALPTSTVASKTMYLGFIYNFTDTKWDLIALTQEV